jgi:EAL domain-containing protein (putative c-di-GMP-specific phosphodiesterase class I)
MAMYRAKENGRSRHERYDEQMRDLVLHRMNTEQWLRDCVAGQGLQLAMQPVVDLRRGTVIGYEALVRCSHPDRGLLQPMEFLRVAEESGLIVPIGQWVMRTALNQAGRWRRRDGRRAPQLAVNVSARQILAPDFYEEVTAALDEFGVPATRLVLEVTENTLLEILDSAAGPLRRLREIGVQIALDDFGTGYTSLTHLRQLPVDALKIDRSFVAGMPDEKSDGGVVQALIGLAHALGLRTVAEGVETPRQRRALREYGCDLGQGFLLGAPAVVAGGNQASVTPFPRALTPALSSPSHNN